jgi:Domain of unknown function (DUF6377)
MSKGTLMLLAICLLTGNHLLANQKTDSLYNALDNAIKNSTTYLQQKKNRIESLTIELHKTSNLRYTLQDRIYNDLYNEYSSFNYDSAFMYARHLLRNAYESKNNLLINKARIKVGFILLSSGLFKETLDTLDNVSLKSLPDSLRRDYYALLSRTYFDMADYANENYFSKLYNELGYQKIDSAISLSKENSENFLSLSGLKYLRKNSLKEARFFYEKLLKSKTLDGHQYAIEASSLGYIYKNDHEPELALQMLIRAAIADIEASIKETVAIRNVAEILYQEGDNKRAYNYVKLALEDANFYGARHRKIQISDILPSIEDKQNELLKHKNRTILIYSISATILSILVILFVIIIFRQLSIVKKAKKYLSGANARLSEINRKLLEANLIKEEYIGHFFDIISEYISRLEKLKVNVNRKIITHQIDDIKDIISTIDIKKEREQFYNSFDSIFLKIFPSFIEVFNSFVKDEKIVITPEQILPPEVRIYALIRLGIADNDKIARFLGYSLNTIYSYKTRIKNRLTIPMDEFEKKLMRIRTI